MAARWHLRGLFWLGAGAVVVLCARTLVYALSPSPLAAAFEHQAGGPSLPFVAVGALAAGLGLAAAIVAVAAMGVRERALVELAVAPKLRLRRLALRAAVMFAATSAGFDLFDSYTHWRAGLGWHGIDCLTGPVHRNAIPFLAALSVIACALAAALEHVLSWMRRTIALIRASRLRFAPLPLVAAFADVHAPPARIAGACGPPVAVS